MNARGWLLMAAVIATSCGQGASHDGTPTASFARTTPTITSQATAQPEPTTATSARTDCSPDQSAPVYGASAPSNRNLALVSLRGGDAYVVRDNSDINHAFTVGSLQNLDGPQFVNGTELAYRSYLDENLLIRRRVTGSPGTVVATACIGMIAFAWSPDGTEAAYVTDLSDRPGSELYIVGNGKNRIVATMASVPWGVDCGWPCVDFIDSRLSFSPDGSKIAFVQNWGGPSLRIWTKDGGVLASVDSIGPAQGAPTMSAWSGSSLYFRDSKGVERWSQGTTSLVLPGVKWIRPKASPAGGFILYEVRDSSGLPNVYLLDTATGQAREIARSRSEPVFLTSRYLWWQGERACTSKDPYPCSAGPWSAETGKTYVYDLETGTDTESIITHVWDVWPHPA